METEKVLRNVRVYGLLALVAGRADYATAKELSSKVESPILQQTIQQIMLCNPRDGDFVPSDTPGDDHGPRLIAKVGGDGCFGAGGCGFGAAGCGGKDPIVEYTPQTKTLEYLLAKEDGCFGAGGCGFGAAGCGGKDPRV